MKKYLSDYVRFNLWANTRLIDVFKAQDDALISKEIISSFPSIRATLLHLWDVEILWMARLNGHSPKTFPSKTFTGSNTEVYENLLTASSAFVKFVEKQPAKFFKETANFESVFSEVKLTNQHYEMIWHCINHQSFHRGQLVTFARQLGITDIPSTDYIVYLREKK